jgi:hypothetical protein
MNLTWEEQNTYQRFSVTMTYRFHTVDFTQGYINLPGDSVRVDASFVGPIAPQTAVTFI